MAKKPTIASLTNGWASASRLNTILQQVLSAFDNTLSRDGSTPNQMNADIDLNNNDLLNVKSIVTTDITVNGGSITDSVNTAVASAATATSAATAASNSATSAANSASAVQAIEDNLPDWKGSWSTSTVYETGDLVSESGSSYICIEDHTSSTFNTDLVADKWELFAAKGSAGAGTGDLLAENNLSDLEDKAVARSNLSVPSVTEMNTAISDAEADELSEAQVTNNANTDFGLVSGQRLSQAVAEFTPSVSALGAPAYTSSNASWYGTWTKRSHGLARNPRMVQYTLRCTAANNGYAIGDRITLSSGADFVASWLGVHAYYNTTEIGAYVSNITIRDKSTGGGIQLSTSANWTLEIEVW